MACTVVSAFYPIKSKFPIAQYLEWGKTFMKLASPIILFTEEIMIPQLLEMRENRPIKIFPVTFTDLDSWKLYKDNWISNHAIDPENFRHNPELYAIWAQKAFFVKKAIELNPFSTEYFFWHDFGGFRNPDINPVILNTFPTTYYFKDDKLLLQGLNYLQDSEKTRKEDSIYGMKLDSTWNECRLVGGLWGGSKKACLNWFNSYKNTLERYFKNGRFAGKDQIVMLSTYLENPDLAVVVQCTTPNIDEWFFLQYLLSGTNTPFILNDSYLISRPIVSVNIMGGLGNQMFQLSTAYAYAKKNNGCLKVLRNKRFHDSRPLYWDSQLSGFKNCLVDLLPPNLINWTETGATEYNIIPSLSSEGIYLNGYLQSPKYFSDSTVIKELKYLFQPSAKSKEYISNKFKQLIENKNRVIVVHARRTDYLRNQDIINFHGPLTAEYYKTAVERICKTVQNPIFLLAADDPTFWIDILDSIPQFRENNLHILNDETEIDTLALLQQFNYYIIANSTFSWWAAWLSEDPRIVIAPAKWFGPTGPQNYQDIYCPEWIQI